MTNTPTPEEKNFDTQYAKSIICPHCGYDHQDWHEYMRDVDESDLQKINCEDCGKNFEFRYEKDLTFFTYKI